jgi:hypothetical protein
MSKYAAALLHIVIVVLGALSTSVDKGLNTVSVVQLAILALGAVSVYLLPLVQWKYTGALKLAASALSAGLTALVPFLIQGSISPSEWITVILGAIGVVAVALGIDARTASQPPAAPAAPPVSL